MKIINKNILDVTEGFIVQSVNCQKVMGSGLAKQIKERYPIVFKRYKDHIEFYDRSVGERFELLGDWQEVQINENLSVINIFGQLNFGQGKQTEYCAINEALRQMAKNYWGTSNQFYFPYGFGAGLGGGDWKIISKIIEKHFPAAIICKLSS